mmetsp:Transcript_6675/g.12600  ORF Transcript_6675/g.12600 Transcript_6675/m.12600 type:complete len:560 (-) Transcript_6675:210-1889(-)
MFGFLKGKRKTSAKIASGSGIGYGGQKGDTKRLIAGRKQAEKERIKDDQTNLLFLKQIQEQVKFQTDLLSDDGDDVFDLEDADKTKVSALLADIFRSTCPTDWDKRKKLYTNALEVCRILSANEKLGAVFGDKQDQEGVLFWLLEFRDQAEQIKKHHSESGLSKEDKADLLLATQVIEVADVALKISRRCQASKPEVELSVISLSERYQSQLGPLRFDTVESMDNNFYLKKVPHASPSLNTRNLFKELAAYRTALPVEYGSSCFCRVINNRLDLLRVMITGPDETPYANGCYFFDINLPTTYPRVPPLVHFLTTDGGKIRFNPNLYNCGKVCLSLLGTWAGPGWISGQSTLLQVLISIQSLILVPDPYFNEPGWERERGSAIGTARSKGYNNIIRKGTISTAIESHLSSILGTSVNPYVEFESAMINHFLEKSRLIQKELWSWVVEDRSLMPSVSNVCNLLDQLDKRERGPRVKRSRGIFAMAKNTSQACEPIVLDDSDSEEDCTSQFKKLSNDGVKPNETIEIDLSDDEEEKKEENSYYGANKSSGVEGGCGLIDLTG